MLVCRTVGRWSGGTESRPCTTVANANLNRCGDGPDRERDDEAQVVVAIAPTAQHPGRINRSDQESAHQKLVYDFLSLADRPARGITRPG
jgi:hypothetical protein